MKNIGITTITNTITTIITNITTTVRPLGRIGGDDWLNGGDYFDIPRPAR